jgi:hypothetical protein
MFKVTDATGCMPPTATSTVTELASGTAPFVPR